MVNDYYEHVAPPTLSAHPGYRHTWIVSADAQGKSRSSWAFIDITNGDILKAAGWGVPAKGARGNVLQPEGWKKWVNLNLTIPPT